ncbi:MAG: hypothetical protein JOS17DRAFT_576860 [Linnemannia elongata]|nr:MAG: hypothetical protein JOS17DRAFT_576860 [Linnemannia elongata]
MMSEVGGWTFCRFFFFFFFFFGLLTQKIREEERRKIRKRERKESGTGFMVDDWSRNAGSDRIRFARFNSFIMYSKGEAERPLY